MAADYGGSYTDVGARIPHKDIGASTEPSLATVDAWIESAEAKINNVLAFAGLTVPIATVQHMEELKALSIDYAEGRTRRAYAAAGGDGANDDGKDLIEAFEAALTAMKENPASTLAYFSGGSVAAGDSRVRGTTAGNSNDPLFSMRENWRQF